MKTFCEEKNTLLRRCSKALVKDPAVAKKIVFHREVLHRSLEGRPLWLLTLSSPEGLKSAREQPVKGLFPENGAGEPPRSC